MGKIVMKKTLLTLLVILFSFTSVNAVTTITHYNNAGVPVSVRQVGGPTYATNVFGKPYSQSYYTTQRMRQAYRMNPYGYRMGGRGMYPPPPPQTRRSSISTLDKNFNVRIPKRSYSIGGITYYN